MSNGVVPVRSRGERPAAGRSVHHRRVTLSATYTTAPAATTAAAGQAVGISLVVFGTPITPAGFAVMTVVFAVLGLLIAMVTHLVATAIVIPSVARRLRA
jgi:hypothetical protein